MAGAELRRNDGMMMQGNYGNQVKLHSGNYGNQVKLHSGNYGNQVKLHSGNAESNVLAHEPMTVNDEKSVHHSIINFIVPYLLVYFVRSLGAHQRAGTCTYI
jgi:hypothetical protein